MHISICGAWAALCCISDNTWAENKAAHTSRSWKYVLIFQMEGARCNVIIVSASKSNILWDGDETSMGASCLRWYSILQTAWGWMLVALNDVTFCKELLGHVSCEVCKPDLCVVKNIVPSMTVTCTNWHEWNLSYVIVTRFCVSCWMWPCMFHV